MNHVFFIGNGFDLSHGLKTSYLNFIEWFLQREFAEKIIEYNSGNLKSYKTEFYAILPRNINRDNFSPYNQKPFIENLSNLISGISFNSIFFKELFLNYISYKDGSFKEDNWFDIEQAYYNNLSSLARTNDIYGIQNLNLFFEYLIRKLKEYIRDVEEHIDEVPLPEYFEIFESRISARKIIVDFNYTYTFQKKYRHVLNENDAYISIHGKCNREIVFGYGDEMHKDYSFIEDINNNEYLKYFKSFQYFKNAEYEKFRNLIAVESFNLSIIGHSAGLSDRLLLNEVFENSSCQSITAYHYLNKTGQSNFTDLTMNISRHFIDKKMLRNKVRHFDESHRLPQV